MTLTTLKQFTITTSLVFLSLTITYGQNCKEQIINQLRGTWIKEGHVDTALVIIKDEKLEFNYKGARNWNEPYTINITNKIPEISDSISDCKFIELTNSSDTRHYKVLVLTDSIMSLTQYSISKYSFYYAEDRTPLTHVDKVISHYRKTKGLPMGYNFKESVFGTWRDEATTLLLKPDSTFSITFSGLNYEYSTCGKFRFNGNHFVLKDIRDNKQIMSAIACDDLKNSPIKERWGNLENKYLLFNGNNEIHLYYGWLGLWLKETHMMLTKMR